MLRRIVVWDSGVMRKESIFQHLDKKTKKVLMYCLKKSGTKSSGLHFGNLYGPFSVFSNRSYSLTVSRCGISPGGHPTAQSPVSLHSHADALHP